MYLLIQKIAILKRILPKIALDYFSIYIEQEDLTKLFAVLDEFYYDKNAIVGELVTQSIVLLENYYGKEAGIDGSMPKKFFTRLKKYRSLFSQEFKTVIDQINQIKVLEQEEESQLVTDIKKQITELTTFTEPDLKIQKVLEAKDISLEEGPIEDDFELDLSQVSEKRSYLQVHYTFLQKQLGIPNELFDSILDIMVWYNITFLNKKRMIKSLNVSTMIIILAFWSLILYATKNYITDKDLLQFNEYLKKHLESHHAPRCVVTTKLLESAENEILKAMFNRHNQSQVKTVPYQVYS